MSTRYCNNNWIKAIEDLEWLIQEIKDEQDCIKEGIIDKPISGFNGFWYGLVKDFGLDSSDEYALQCLITTNADSKLTKNANNDYYFHNADTLISVLKDTINFIVEQKINCQITINNN